MNRRWLNLALLLVTMLSQPGWLCAQLTESPSELDTAKSGVLKANTECIDAAAAVSRAEVAKMRLQRTIDREYQSRPDVIELRQYAGATTRYYNALRNAVLNELEQDPDHIALQKKLEDSAARLRSAQADHNRSMLDKMAFAYAMMSARKDLTQFESIAIALDPAIEDARAEMNRTHDASSKLELFYRKQAASDARLSQAADEVKHTKDRVDAARTALADAKVKLAEAEKREAMRTADRRRANPPPITRPDP